MFNKLGSILGGKFSRKDDLSHQLEIVKVFDIYKREVKKIFPEEEINPVSLRNKILKIEVRSSVLANELRMREGKIVSEINEAIGKEAVTRVLYRF